MFDSWLGLAQWQYCLPQCRRRKNNCFLVDVVVRTWLHRNTLSHESHVIDPYACWITSGTLKTHKTVRSDLLVMKFTCYAISHSPKSNMWVHIEVNMINNPWDSNAILNVFLTGLVSIQMFRILILICWYTLIQKLLYSSWKIVITSDGCGLVGV